jgi:hypothetical protein
MAIPLGFYVNFLYSEGDAGKYTPVVRNIYLENIKSKKSQYAFYLEGYKRSPITNIQIKNSSFNGVINENKLNHYQDLHLSNVYINGKIQ